MGDLDPIAFDIETSGFGNESVLTVAGFASTLGEVVILNTAGRQANSTQLEQALAEYSDYGVDVIVTDDEAGLLSAVEQVATDRLNKDRHYLTAYNGETWKGGFDLPYLRTACISHDVAWPFPNMAYADVFEFVDRFDTHDEKGLVGVYDELIGKANCDPFDDSKEAVDAFESGKWEPLLLHNLADIQRTLELAMLGERYVPRSDFKMKNLSPPN
ncbi:hypothetical protein [Halohasta litorea]|uniref:Uncharacterized protein n=1 Tax=Halohasta litorea TaxID=869891 RepID=A0ABD6DA33_9EURY|nr:hypothetical protein [Halohasta litorea]